MTEPPCRPFVNCPASFESFCLRELAQARDADLQYLTRPAWTAAIILMIPLGGIAFLYYGRPH